jgi:hypothetical protein
MKTKHLSLTFAALVVACAVWLAWAAWRTDSSLESSVGADGETRNGHVLSPSNIVGAQQRLSGPEIAGGNSKSSPMPNSPPHLAPPVPNRRFTDFTPEERVKFARQGHGPGG